MTPDPTAEETATERALRLRLTIAERALDLFNEYTVARSRGPEVLRDWINDLRPLVRALRNREESPR